MKLRGFAIAIGILGFCCHGSWAVDCNDKSSVLSSQRLCFQRYGLELNVESDQIHTAAHNDPETTCRNKMAYKRAVRCAMYVTKQCLVTLGQSPNILPDTNAVVRGITYLCTHIHNIDVQCVKNKTDATRQCVKRKTMSAFAGHAAKLDVARIACTAYKYNAVCLQKELSSCGYHTQHLYVKMAKKYLNAPACPAIEIVDTAYNTASPFYHDTTLAPMTTVAPLTTFQLVTWVPLTHHVSCYSKSSIQDGQKRCFQQEGLTVELPEFHTLDGTRSKQSYINSVMANNKDLHTTCRHLPQYQRAIGCATDLARQCMPESYKDYLPSSRHIQMMLLEICDNVDGIKQQCVVSKASDLFDCGYNYGKTIRTRDVKAILCLAYKYNAVCLQKELSSCGYRTQHLYVKMAKKYLNAPACPAIEIVDTGYNTASPFYHDTTLAPMTTVAPLTTFQLVTWVPLTHHVSCYSKSSIQDGQKRCFQQEGLTVELPEFHTADGTRSKQSYIDSVMANNKDLHTTCRQLPQYQRAIGCATDLARQCMAESYKDYLPSSRHIQMMLLEICDNVDGINQQCVVSKASDLFDCGYNYGKTIRTRDVKGILCLAYKYNAMCLQKELSSCGSLTQHLYVDMAKKYLNAPACPAIEIAQTGRAANSLTSVCLLSVAALLARLVHV